MKATKANPTKGSGQSDCPNLFRNWGLARRQICHSMLSNPLGGHFDISRGGIEGSRKLVGYQR